MKLDAVEFTYSRNRQVYCQPIRQLDGHAENQSDRQMDIQTRTISHVNYMWRDRKNKTLSEANHSLWSWQLPNVPDVPWNWNCGRFLELQERTRRRGGGGGVETGREIRVSVVEWCYQRTLFLGLQEERDRTAETNSFILILTTNVDIHLSILADCSVHLSSKTLMVPSGFHHTASLKPIFFHCGFCPPSLTVEVL